MNPKLLLFGIIAIIFSCSTSSRNSKMKEEPVFKKVLFVPWGDKPNQFKGKTSGAYPAGLSLEPDQTLSKDPISFRLGPNSSFHLLSHDSSYILSFSNNGIFESRTDLKMKSEVLDFVIGQDAFFFLLKNPDNQILLSSWSYVGTLNWTSVPIGESITEGIQLHLNASKLVLTSLDSGVNCLVFDSKSGTVSKKNERQYVGNSFLIDPNKLLSVVYFPATRSRGVSIFDLSTGAESAHSLSDDYYGALTTTFGADRLGNIYMYTNRSLATESSLLVLDQQGQMLYKDPFFCLYPDSSGDPIYELSKDGLDLELVSHGTKTERTLIPGHSDWASEMEDKLEMTSINDLGQIQVNLRNSNNGQTTCLVFEDEWKIKRKEEPQFISRMQTSDFWNVSLNGEVFIEISHPEGIFIVSTKAAI